jgi:hypothetical protein
MILTLRAIAAGPTETQKGSIVFQVWRDIGDPEHRHFLDTKPMGVLELSGEEAEPFAQVVMDSKFNMSIHELDVEVPACSDGHQLELLCRECLSSGFLEEIKEILDEAFDAAEAAIAVGLPDE